MTVESILSEAMAKHRTGNLDGAETLYKEILSIDPGDPDVLNLLGVLSLQCDRLEEAGQLIRRAINVDPTIAEYHYNLAEVLRSQGEADAAQKSYRQSLELNPQLEIAKDHLASLTQSVPGVPMADRHPLKRFEVVQAVIDRIKAKTYLEIGIDSGESFVNISAERKYGVDPVPTSELINRLLQNVGISFFKYASVGSNGAIQIALNATNTLPGNMPVNEISEFYYETSDLFFAQHAPLLFKDKPVDLAFVDGLHTYQQTYLDVANALDFLSQTGVILMHGCNPPKEASAFPAPSWKTAAKMHIPGWDGRWCGDVWKSIVRLRATRGDLRVFVLDCDFGIGVVYKGQPEGTLDISIPDIENLTYADLQKNRERILNLKPQDYLYEFLRTKC